MLFSNSKNGRRNSGSKEFIRSLASDRFPTFAVKRIFPTLSALLPGKVIGTFGNPKPVTILSRRQKRQEEVAFGSVAEA